MKTILGIVNVTFETHTFLKIKIESTRKSDGNPE